MEPLECRYCGEQIQVSAEDEPVSFREDPSTAFTPAQYVVVGRSWLLHRCGISRLKND